MSEIVIQGGRRRWQSRQTATQADGLVPAIYQRNPHSGGPATPPGRGLSSNGVAGVGRQRRGSTIQRSAPPHLHDLVAPSIITRRDTVATPAASTANTLPTVAFMANLFPALASNEAKPLSHGVGQGSDRGFSAKFGVRGPSHRATKRTCTVYAYAFESVRVRFAPLPPRRGVLEAPAWLSPLRWTCRS